MLRGKGNRREGPNGPVRADDRPHQGGRCLLRAALGFLSLEPREPELQLPHRCFDNWRGIGDIVAGMAPQEYDARPGAREDTP